jgi:uncharacterized heparinase superfamily protein
LSRSLSALSKLPARLPVFWRTLRWIRPAQARAQIRHMLFGPPARARLNAAAPAIAIAAPVTGYLPPPTHVRASSGDHIELLATPFELGSQPDWTTTEHGPLFAYHLHQHEYLRSLAFQPANRVARMLDWIDRHPSGVGWDPHPISLRLLCWGKMLTTSGMLEAEASSRERILGSMADQAETLRRGLEIRLQANHLFSNLLSMVWCAVLLEGDASPRWLACVPLLIAEIDDQIQPDGGHQERSPMYHSLLLENLLDLLNLCRAEPSRAPVGLIEALEAAASRMLAALRVWTHPDRDIALFADSAFDIAAKPAALIDYAKRLGVESALQDEGIAGSAVLSQSGYVRLAAPGSLLLASVSAPAPAHQPGHAHCDALAFELSLGGHRVITDTGLFEYRPGPRRDQARATAAHSTLQIDDEEQAEVWSAHRIGGRPVVELLGWDGDTRAEASCRGWSRRKTLHRRSYRVDARSATIVDRIEGPCRSVRFVLPFDPAWRVELREGSSSAIATRGGGEDRASGRVELELPIELAWRLGRAPYYPSFGRELERDVLIGEGAGFDRATLRIGLVD